MAAVLLISVFVIATCGLVYELIAGTVASYLLGDSITQFSTVIGAYLCAMGVGSFASRYITRNLLTTFIQVELLIGLIGGFSALALFVAFEQVASFRLLLYSLVSLTGILVGLEIPLLMRILKQHYSFSDLVSRVFAVDYIGALLASLVFPMVLVPHLGLVRSGLLFGMFNVGVALWALVLFRADIPAFRALRTAGIIVLILQLGTAIGSDRLTTSAEATHYPDPIIYSASSPYQRIVLTKYADDLRLYLNGNLQFSARDEYRYHEALVHVPMAAMPTARHVLVLGGGDGLAVREVLKYPQVESVTLVDLDAAVTKLFSTHPLLTTLNAGSLTDKRVRVIPADAFVWLRDSQQQFDVAIVDFPDSSSFAVGKLYTDTFYKVLKQRLSPTGVAVIQSTSPYYARETFGCVVNTLRAAGFFTQPYHAYVPSFGDWGFVLAGQQQIRRATPTVPGLRFLSASTLDSLFQFPPDMRARNTDVNQLNNQALVHWFEREWAPYTDAH